MLISLSTLHSYSSRYTRGPYESIYTAKRDNTQTAFLSHSHHDAKLAKGVQGYLEKQGCDVYIDWEDHEMPSQPSRETAEKLQKKIQDCDWFLYLATVNSSNSKWCPWEIGYADSAKGKSKLLILPTRDGNKTHGNEYIELYRKIDLDTRGNLYIYDRGTLISRLDSVF